MKTRFFSILLLLMGFSLSLIPTVFAEEELSDGCKSIHEISLTANDTATYGADTFKTGETIRLAVSGTGDSYTVSVNDVAVSVNNTMDVAVDYTFPSDGEFTIKIVVSNAGADTTVNFTCLDADEGDDDDGDDDDDDGDDDDDNSGTVTVCHRPPGNPDNAHTITIGRPALDAHLAHGDSEGACSPEEDTRYDDPSNGIVIITVGDDDDGGVEIYAECANGNCTPIAIIVIADLSPTADGEFPFDANPDDEWDVIVYYLGNQDRDGDGEFVDVYQINIYKSDTLINDDVLILIKADGTVLWDRNSNPDPVE